MLNRKIEMKEKQLAMVAARKTASAPVPAPVIAQPVAPERAATPPPASSAPLQTVMSPPHGLPPKPINPLGIPTRPNTPSVVVTAPAAPTPPPPAPVATKEASAPKIKLSDPQLEAFLDVSGMTNT